MGREFKITAFDPAQYQAFRVSDGYDATTIMIRQTPVNLGSMDKNTGIGVAVWGSHTNCSHFWPACGPTAWWDWLEDTDMDYFMNKMFGRSWREFDGEKTLKVMRDYVIDQRRNSGYFSKADARDAWDVLTDADPSATMHKIIGAVDNTRIFDDCYYDFAQTRPKPGLAYFWENIWRPFIIEAKATKGTMRRDD